MLGQCRLCLEVKKLRDSHYLSKGIYRILREDGFDNPNPWVLTKKTAVQSSKQETAYLLCQDCEQRFNENGERWVLKHCLRKDGKSRLADILAAKKPVAWSDTTKLYYAHDVPEINISALAYFAASIFWRGSIHPWNYNGSFPVTLGPFQEPFRQYLMEEQAFPKDCSLFVVVREGKEVDRLTFPPTGGRRGNFHLFNFPMPGLAFTLITSKNIPIRYREKCFVHGSGNPIIAGNVIEPYLEETAVRMFSRLSKKGTFGKDGKFLAR